MKLHYFTQVVADADDAQLQMSIAQGYVPETCLLGGRVVWSEAQSGRDACAGCEGPREKCHGRPKRGLQADISPPPLPPPQYSASGSRLKCFGSMDFGYNAPGCFLLWLALPDGHYHIWREVKFQHTPVTEVGEDIKKRLKSLGLKLDYLVADPACWQHTGAGKGEAIGETLQRIGLPMRKGDNDRKNGWQRVHELLKPAADGTPWLTIESDPHCKYLRRTLAGAVSDKNDADDVDTHSDDHALDALRYGAMSRPPIGRAIVQQAQDTPWTFGWLKNQGIKPRGILAGRSTHAA